MHTIGEKIALLRRAQIFQEADDDLPARVLEAKGWTQKELANRISVKVGSITDWETDNHLPSIDLLQRIAKVCHIHMCYFFEDVSVYEGYMISENIRYAEMLGRLPELVGEYFCCGLEEMFKVQAGNLQLKTGQFKVRNKMRSGALKRLLSTTETS